MTDFCAQCPVNRHVKVHLRVHNLKNQKVISPNVHSKESEIWGNTPVFRFCALPVAPH